MKSPQKQHIHRIIFICLLMVVGWGQDCIDGVEVELWDECYNIEETDSLDLSWDGLTGEIPEQIGSLTNLTYLNLQYNLLSGEIPSEIGSLTNLSELNLGENDLSGGIPSNIQNLINLSILRLGYNEITGEIPSWIGDLTNLTGLSLSSNQLIGGIPPEIGNLTNLTYLYLDSNLLTGYVPETICNLNNLYFSPWVLQNNQLCPPYPECIENDIGYQDTSNCELPSLCNEETEIELWGVCYNIEETDSLDLSGNLFSSGDLTGEIPPEIGNLTNLTFLNLGFNYLTGEIPSEIGNLTNLEYLSLVHNQLTGVLPEELCNLGVSWGSLLYGVTHNQLCPPYPDCGDGPITSEDEQDISECPPLSISELTIPNEYTLHQPFPNPFNPTTTLSFSIPEQSQTFLKVYDIKGNLISTLLNQTMNVGHHQIEWNGENLTSGTYFIRINSGEFSDVKKVVLVK